MMRGQTSAVHICEQFGFLFIIILNDLNWQCMNLDVSIVAVDHALEQNCCMRILSKHDMLCAYESVF